MLAPGYPWVVGVETAAFHAKRLPMTNAGRRRRVGNGNAPGTGTVGFPAALGRSL